MCDYSDTVLICSSPTRYGCSLNINAGFYCRYLHLALKEAANHVSLPRLASPKEAGPLATSLLRDFILP